MIQALIKRILGWILLTYALFWLLVYNYVLIWDGYFIMPEKNSLHTLAVLGITIIGPGIIGSILLISTQNSCKK